jgi:hypothetical protein
MVTIVKRHRDGTLEKIPVQLSPEAQAQRTARREHYESSPEYAEQRKRLRASFAGNLAFVSKAMKLPGWRSER